MAKRRNRLLKEDGHLDLVPLIDCVFLLLLFFMLCGHLCNTQRPEQITVPPARTATRGPETAPRVVFNLIAGERPVLCFANVRIDLSRPQAWQEVRARLDAIWDRAGKRFAGQVEVADAILELRADADTAYRLVQEFEQIASGSIDPATMLPRSRSERPFTNLDFTARSTI